MSCGRTLDFLYTNPSTSPRPLALFADSAQLGPKDVEVRALGV